MSDWIRKIASDLAGLLEAAFSRPATQRYALTLLVVAIVAFLRFLLAPVLLEGASLMLFMVAVVWAALIGGLGAGVLAAGLSLVVDWYLGVRTQRFSLNDQVQLIVFIGVSLSISLLSHGMTLLRAREQQARAELEDLNRTLEERVSKRTRELNQRNQELQQFAYLASHDLQEPLRKIRSFGTLLEERATDRLDETSRLYLHRMSESAARMSRFISDLLAFSRVSSARQEFETISLDETLKGVLSDLELRIASSGATIEADSLPTIEADGMQMHQLLLNLVGNALKFHRQDVRPRISISSSLVQLGEEPGIEVTVRDNGIGFDPQLAARVFLPFQRLVGRSEYEGSGIGLAICQRIVERHRGSIRAESQPGQGSTFIVRLPVAQASQALTQEITVLRDSSPALRTTQTAMKLEANRGGGGGT